MWVFKPENAWHSIHQGADIRIPAIYKFIMTYITPVYLFVILGWWAVADAWPILTLERMAGGGPVRPEQVFYVHASRAIMLGFVVAFVVLIRMAWKRNGYDDRKGFVEVEGTPAGAPPDEAKRVAITA
jgi:hypothetical protein